MPRLNLYTSARPFILAPVKAREGSVVAETVAEYHRAMVAAEKARITLDGLNGKESDATRAKVEEAYADAVAMRDALAVQAKSSVTIRPAKGAKVMRYNVSEETFAAWRAESDPEKRAAILADVTPTTTSSAVTPSIAAHAGMVETYRALTPEGEKSSAVLLAGTDAGWFVIPSRGSGPSAAKDSRTAAEKAAEAAAAMFGE